MAGSIGWIGMHDSRVVLIHAGEGCALDILVFGMQHGVAKVVSLPLHFDNVYTLFVCLPRTMDRASGKQAFPHPCLPKDFYAPHNQDFST